VTGPTHSDGGVSTIKRARAEIEEDDVRAHAARIVRLSAMPAICWTGFLPIDVVFTRALFPESTAVVVSIRLVVGVLLGGLYFVIRRHPPRTRNGVDLLLSALMLALAGPIGVIASFCGGVTSIHGAGALIVMSVPSFIELPWARGARVAAVGVASFVAACAITESIRGTLAGEIGDLHSRVTFEAHVFLLMAMGVIAVVGGHLGHRLRQQVYESRSIGRYKLQRLLGRGGMGEVWAAYHNGLKRDVALKILRDQGPRSVSRFEREVQALADLRHPNTVRVFDYGATDDGLLYYAMELLVGVDFGSLVKKTGPLPAPRAVHLVLQAARALAEAHQKGMVHRDVKPENLFIASAGGEVDFVKVLDFGIVRLEREGAETLTQAGQFAGTPAFMAPEVGLGEEADRRSDVYALGAVLYYLLTGAPPFEGKGTAAMLTAHRTQPVVPPSLRMSTELPKQVEEIVLACLSKKREERPADAGVLADQLAATDIASAWRGDETPSPEALAAMPRSPSSSNTPNSEEATRRIEKAG
jgi:hypothetical protein